jgi:hypothetical protein
MKTMLLSLALFICAALSSPAQTDTSQARAEYQAWITTYDLPRITAGRLLEVKDSSVNLSHLIRGRIGEPARQQISKFDARSIESISVRKKGNVGMGVLFGALTGIVAGGIMDILIVSSYQKKTNESKNANETVEYIFVETPQFIAAIAGSIALVGAGIGIGAAAGSAKITIPIDGDQLQFNRNKSKLNGYAAKNNPAFAGGNFSKLPDQVSDTDGNRYPVIALGAQVWMAADLKSTHYPDGSPIPGITPGADGAGNGYPWNCVIDPRNICPAGWHVPAPGEWESLIASLGGEQGTLEKLASGFSADQHILNWWSAGEQDNLQAKSFYMNAGTSVVMIAGSDKTASLPVRCMRDK